jgi:hypothetical protein
MVVVAVRAQKQSSSKAVVWVKFLSPPSHVGKQIQLYPKSLEPKNGPAKGQDFSLLSALELSHPGAKTWKDLGVTRPRHPKLRRACSPPYRPTMEAHDLVLRKCLQQDRKRRSLIQFFYRNFG